MQPGDWLGLCSVGNKNPIIKATVQAPAEARPGQGPELNLHQRHLRPGAERRGCTQRGKMGHVTFA